MKNKIKILCISFLLTLSLVTSAQIDSENFAKLIGTQPTVEINLGPTMLSLLSSATGDKKGIGGILSSLTSINVTVFDLEHSKKTKANNTDITDQARIESIRSEINNLAKMKVSSGYEKIATIKEDDSLVYIFAKMDKKKFNSLSIFAMDDEDELVLIDIKGDIFMSQIGSLMEHFDVDLDINGLEFDKQKEKDQ
ncbi:MAG: DUF4252 domain-containing protein [Alcanivoracaceae bacterium]|nr:DUF4252 domain-containing protein [Alcanivoracaceae bacterium]